ncbi:hypothetical protein GCM10027416_22400 [Okibacterium endophyticum]
MDSQRRITLELRRPALSLHVGVRPTVVIDGRGQPAQWGTGTWQLPVGEPVTIGVYLFNRLWRYGGAETTVDPSDEGPLVYTAPVLPFGRGAFAPHIAVRRR